MAKKAAFPEYLYVRFDESDDEILLAGRDISDCVCHNEYERVGRYKLEAVGQAVNTTQWIGPTASTSNKKKAGKTR